MATIDIWLGTVGAIVGISLLSLVGGLLYAVPGRLREPLEHLLLAFAAGTLLTTATLELLPRAFADAHPETAALGVLAGVLGFYLLEGWLRGTPHEHPEIDGHLHTGHTHTHAISHTTHTEALVPLTLLSDTLHSVVDGVLIALSFLAGPAVGLSLAVAVLLHEVPHELSKFGVLLRRGFTARRALFYIFLTQIAGLLGAVPTLVWGSASRELLPWLTPVLAGCFFYLALGNILPHLLHHREHKYLTWLQLGGLALALLVAFTKHGGH